MIFKRERNMKSSSCSTLLRALILLSLLLWASSSACWALKASQDEAFWAHVCHGDHYHHHHYRHRRRQPPSWCLHLPRGVPLPPPADDQRGDEIDPRYGVAKRLVPTGPNPLHN